MLQPEDINPREIPLIAEIVRNETWLLGEKTGCEVDPRSSEVLSRVVDIVLNIGGQWRTGIESEGGGSSGSQ